MTMHNSFDYGKGQRYVKWDSKLILHSALEEITVKTQKVSSIFCASLLEVLVGSFF